MMNYNSSQIKFAGKILKQKAGMVRQNPMKTTVDLPLSSEMIQLIDSTIYNNDEEGYLSEKVGSVLAQPLGSMAILCPTAAILQSTTTASKIPGYTKSTNFAQSGSFTHETNSLITASVMGEDKPTLQDTKSRLEVMWLKRKSELSYENGNIKEAIEIMGEAINEHLGGKDYINAGLSKPIVSSDPEELLQFIDNDFFVYDKLAHGKASKIQKIYRAWYRYKGHMATMVSKVFRGHMHRKVVRKYKEIRRQCAVLLQRRFRIHLIRMHKLATKIKIWYKLRKDVKAYQKRLRIYQMARRIQRLFRGNKGRERYQRKRRQMLSRMAIQRNFRGSCVRRDRSFALMLFHRTYFLAARKIQLLVRRVQAVQRAQIKLLVELTRESIRSKKEQIVTTEALRMQKIKTHYYVKTAPGKLRLKQLNNQLSAKRVIQSKINETLSEDEAVLQYVVEVVEKYDEDGTGRFDTRQLRKILQKLAIPANKEYLCYIMNKLDSEDLGFVAINSFIDWYQSEEVDELLEPTAFTSKVERIRLESFVRLKKSLQFTKRFSSRVTEKTLRQEQSGWITRDTINTFRLSHPPKYQCCQCLQAFMMFTDYYIHFSKDNGFCQVTNQKALFYPKYWIMSDWKHQRQIEYEVIRVNDEVEFCRSRTNLALYAELAYGRMHPQSQAIEKKQIKQSVVIYKEKCATNGIKSKELKAKTVEMIFEILNLANTYVETKRTEETNNNSINPDAQKSADNSRAPPDISALTDDNSKVADNSLKPSTPATPTGKTNKSGKSSTVPPVAQKGSTKGSVKGGKGSARVPPKAGDKSKTSAAAKAGGNTPSGKSGGANVDNSVRSTASNNSTSSNSGNLTIIPTVLINCVLEVMRIPMKNNWVADNACYTLMELRNWLNRYIKNTHVDDDHGSFTDHHKNALKDNMNQTNPEENKVFKLDAMDRLKSMTKVKFGVPARSEAGKINHRCEELAAIYVKVLRLLYVLTCSELFALVEYRTKRPRRSTLSDEDLVGLELISLTKMSYETKINKLVHTLSVFQQNYIKIYSTKTVKYCHDTLMFWKKMFRYAPIAGEEDPELTVSELLQIQLKESQFLVASEISSKLSSPLGKLVIQRYAAMLKNRQNILLRGNTKSSKMDSALEATYIYYYNLCCWIRSNFSDGGEILDNVHVLDADMLISSFGLRVQNSKKEKILLESLDPDNEGVILYDVFKNWQSDENAIKQFKNPWIMFIQAFVSVQNALHLRKYHWFDARKALTIDKRHILRTEIELQSKFVSDMSRCRLNDNFSEDNPHLVEYVKVNKAIMSVFSKVDPLPTSEPLEPQQSQVSQQLSEPSERIEQLSGERTTSPPVQQLLSSDFETPVDESTARSSDINPMWSKLKQLKKEEEVAEYDAFFDFVENKAERKFWIALFRSNATEWYKVGMEKLFVSAMDGMMLSVSQCGSYSKQWVNDELTIERAPASSLMMETSKSFKSSKSYRTPKSIRIKTASAAATSTMMASSEFDRDSLEQFSPALGHQLYLDTLVNLMDVNCSGALDVRVVRCILKSFKCSVSDRKLLFHFPEFSTPEGMISVGRFVDYLKDKLTYWNEYKQQASSGVSVSRVTDRRLAINLLIAARRQLAHSNVQQTVTLTSFGHISVVDRSQTVLSVNDGLKDFRSVILRSQALALRQVALFVKTIHGKIKLFYLEKTVNYLWELHVTSPIQRDELIHYSIALHSERGRVLITELPFVIQFLIQRFGMTTNTLQLRKIPHLLDKVRTSRDIRWFYPEDLFLLLDPVFEEYSGPRTNFMVRNAAADALINMQSCARQQAVLIAMNFQDIVVPETNYRCSILGLHQVMHQMKDWFPVSKPSDQDSSQFRKNVNWSVIPRECSTLYMLSVGYLYNDFSHPSVEDLVAIDHSSGTLYTDEVIVDSLKKIAKTGIAKTSTWSKSFARLGNKVFRPVKNWKVQQEYKFAVLAIQQCPQSVNKKGADFLKELLTGVSHCAFDQ